MPSPIRRGPGTACNSTEAQKKSTAAKFTRIASEILGMILAALIFASVMLTSVFGMSGGFDQPVAIQVAEVTDGR